MGDTHGVNLRQLEYFVVIAEEGSFTRASERLLVAQPSLSQQIGALEAELGGPLLERMPRGVRLTMAGQNFLPEARAAIGHADRARRSVRMTLGLESGQLEIATITSTAAGILPSVLRRWQELHPSIEVSLSEYLHRRLLEDGVREGDGDIVFMHQIAPGSADKSYGIHVAKIAGLPRDVVERATVILAQLEADHMDESGRIKIPARPQGSSGRQLSLFIEPDHPVIEKLKSLDLEQLTPLAALQKLNEFRQELAK